MLLFALAAACNAVMDVLAHKFSTSIFWSCWHPFWDPNRSWERKYKDNDKWYGWINDTILVWTTDAWHLFQMFMKSFIVLAIVCYIPVITWYWDILLFTIAWGVVFELFYKYLLILRKSGK